MTPEQRWDLEVRAERILKDWAFERFDNADAIEEEGHRLILLANVGRCIFKWRRLGEGYDGTYVGLIGKTEDEAFNDLSAVEQRGVLAGLNVFCAPITYDNIPPVFDEKMEEWVSKLEQMRLAEAA